MTTTANIHRRRNWLPTLNLLVAGAALTVGVVAITTDNASTANNLTDGHATQEAQVNIDAKDHPQYNPHQPQIGRTGTFTDPCNNRPVRDGRFAC